MKHDAPRGLALDHRTGSHGEDLRGALRIAKPFFGFWDLEESGVLE
jgi:hypothetical protein